jgi:hypothetical protein
MTPFQIASPSAIVIAKERSDCGNPELRNTL